MGAFRYRRLLIAALSMSGAISVGRIVLAPAATYSAPPAGLPQLQAPRSNQPSNPAAAPLRVATRLVLVDAVVTDSNGKRVTGLTANDFELWEDGKRQEIKGFAEVSAPSLPAKPVVPLVSGSYTNASRVRPEGGPPIIVLLDALNTPFEDQAYARSQLADYLKTVGPARNVSLCVLGRSLKCLQELVGEPQQLQAALSDHPPQIINIPSAEDKPGISVSPEPAQQASNMSPSPLSLPQQVRAFEAVIENFNGDVRMHSTIDALRSVARQANGIPGRKTLLWLTAGVPFDSFESLSHSRFREEFEEAAKALTDARVAVYPIDARGLPITPTPVTTHFGMNDIAGWTGGRAFYERNDLDHAMAQAVGEGASYYVLDYYPANKNWNGEFRSIQVKVLRKGLQVRCRKGYFATDRSKPTPRQTKSDLQEFADALSPDALGATSIPFVATVIPPGKDHRQVWVDVNVDPHQVVFEDPGDHRRHAKLEFVTVVQDAKGKKISVKVDTLNTNLSAESFAKVMASSLAVREKFDLAAGKYTLCIGVRDMKSNLIGSLTAPVDVPLPAK